MTSFLYGLVLGLHSTHQVQTLECQNLPVPFSWRQGQSLTDEVFIITIFYLWHACMYKCARAPLHLGPRQLPKSPQMLLMNIPRQRWPRFAVIDYLYVK